MKPPIIPILVMVASLGTGLYLYQQNRVLERDIAASAKQCRERLAALENDYIRRLDELRQRLPLGQRQGARAADRDNKTEFHQLISHGHRVAAVSHKYEFLLETAQITTAEKDNLRRLLLQREGLSNDLALVEAGRAEDISAKSSAELKNELNEIENQISVVLKDPLDYTRYKFLKQKSL